MLDKLSDKTTPQSFSLFDATNINNSGASNLGTLSNPTSGSLTQSGTSAKNAAQLSADRIFALDPQTPQEKAEATSSSNELVARGLPGGLLKPIIPPGRVPGVSPGGGSPFPFPFSDFFDNNSRINSSTPDSVIKAVIEAADHFDGDINATTQEALKSFAKTGNKKIDIEVATQVQQAVIKAGYDKNIAPGNILAIRDAMRGRVAPINLKKIENQVAKGQIPRKSGGNFDADCTLLSNTGVGIPSIPRGNLIAGVNSSVLADPGISGDIAVATRAQQTITRNEGPLFDHLFFNHNNLTYEFPTKRPDGYTRQEKNIQAGHYVDLSTTTDATPKPMIPTYVQPSIQTVGGEVKFGMDDLYTDNDNRVRGATYAEVTSDALHGKGGGSYCVFAGQDGQYVVPARTTDRQPFYKTEITTLMGSSGEKTVPKTEGNWPRPPRF